MGDHLRHKQPALFSNDIFDDELANAVNDRMPELTSKCYSVMLVLSHRAGIARMSNEAFELACTAMINIIGLLIRPACTELISINERGNGKRLLAPGQSIFRVPPLSLAPVCYFCEGVHEYVHTLVPRQVEDAAKSLGITDQVYNDYLLDSDMQDEFSLQMESRYEYQDEEELDYSFEEVIPMDIDAPVVADDSNGPADDKSNDGSRDELLVGVCDEGMWSTTRNAHHCVIS